MRLCSIINVWADCLELLPFCIQNHLQFCDGIIVVWSSTSNHGVKDDRMLEFVVKNGYPSNVLFVQKEPQKGLKPLENEIIKRNHGLRIAKEQGYTHFLIADADEYYIPEDVNEEKERFDNPNLNGLVCGMFVFVKSPLLWTDTYTLVAFIQKISRDVSVGRFKDYPFAYKDRKAFIDPSRRISHKKGVEFSEIMMHHMSYIRNDIDLKINNSSAKLHRSRQVIYDELRDAKPGYTSRLYHQPLQECENYFGIEI